MDIQVSVLCDFAAEYQGRLCIQGAFDTFVARQFPVVHPMCCLALRFCFEPSDEGDHTLGLSIADSEGVVLDKKNMPITANVSVHLPDGASFFTRDLVLNLQGLRFEKAGIYAVDVMMDGSTISRVPMRVVQVPPEQAEKPATPHTSPEDGKEKQA